MAKKFDLTVHKRDRKGHVTSANPYRLVIENGVQRFERPPNSGNWYDAADNLIKSVKPTELKK